MDDPNLLDLQSDSWIYCTDVNRVPKEFSKVPIDKEQLVNSCPWTTYLRYKPLQLGNQSRQNQCLPTTTVNALYCNYTLLMTRLKIFSTLTKASIQRPLEALTYSPLLDLNPSAMTLKWNKAFQFYLFEPFNLKTGPVRSLLQVSHRRIYLRANLVKTISTEKNFQVRSQMSVLPS